MLRVELEIIVLPQDGISLGRLIKSTWKRDYPKFAAAGEDKDYHCQRQRASKLAAAWFFYRRELNKNVLKISPGGMSENF